MVPTPRRETHRVSGAPLARLWLAGAFFLFRATGWSSESAFQLEYQRVTMGQEQSPQYVVDKCARPQDVAPLVQPTAKLFL